MAIETDTGLVGGRYSIVRELGRGGSAVVFMAEDTQLGGLVALKALHEELRESRSTERFLREIRLLAHLGHPNILPILDSGEWNGRPFYVMTYLDGAENVRDRLRRQPSGLPIDDVLAIGRGACAALGHAHARGVLHRDVKPENILLVGNRTFLTDFGVAKALTPLPGDSTTTSGYVLGTQRYMSPEQEFADPSIDNRTDIWSLGCVIFEALTGLHPFHSPDASRMRSMKISNPPESLRRHRPNAPAWLEEAIFKALQPNPADRWQSAESFAMAIDRSDAADALQPVGGFGDRATAQRNSGTESRATDPALRAFASSPASANDVQPGTFRRPLPRTVKLLIAGAVTVGAMTLTTFALKGDRELPTTRRANVIALNVTAAASQPELREVAGRLNAGVIRELARLPVFRVLSTGQMHVCRESVVACEELLSAQGVGTRIEATLERVGDSLLLVTQIGDELSRSAMPGVTLSAPNNLDGPAIDRLATRMAITLRQRLGTSATRLAESLAGMNEESKAIMRTLSRERADAESLAALAGAPEQRASFEALRRADSLYGLLNARHPRKASLWVERGWGALAMGQRDSQRRRAVLQLAKEYADSAMRYAPGSAQSLELRGHVRMALWQQLKADLAPSLAMECAAIEDLRQAVNLDGSLHRAWSSLGRVLWSAGRTSEARLAVSHAMENDAYLEGARTSYANIFIAQLLLENYTNARQVCSSGRDVWPADFKWYECELTLMLYDTKAPQLVSRAEWLVSEMDRLDSREKARAMGNEYRALYRDVVTAIVAARNRDSVRARQILSRVRAYVADSKSAALKYDFRPEEGMLVWELGDSSSAREILADWLRHRPDEVPNFRQDPRWRRMGVRDGVLRDAGLPLTASPACS